ncbi:F-box/kelch-repeat protein [Vitis vinifera]|uniref:F-box/kelch-repeat protein n=1 Tax=Vitis vinifera TaxID=29760 RepID=A0A438JC72_VITVI|nr:F-box/kelch-repeat protein [Vitis vinifera]
MDGIGGSSESGSGEIGPQLSRNGFYREEESCVKHVSALGGGGSRNTSPLGRVGSRNTSPSRQKVIKTPRGLDEETVTTFGKAVQPDVQMEDNIWAMLPEDLLIEILARVPPFMIFRLRSVWGLVCFSGLDGLTFKTLVCNPLTQRWQTLPSMHHNQQRQLIMVVDRTDRSFKVIATSDIYGDKSLPTEVYDSKLNSWSLHQIMPAVNLCSSKMAFCDSRLYLETLSPLGLMMYRLDTGYWEHIPAKFPRSLLDGYLVAGTQKRLFLVGRIGLYSTLQSMRIWELDHAKFMWVEMSRMPPKYFRALLRLSAERFECFGQDNLICFTSWNQGKGLLYDVDKKVWSWIAGCALQSYNSQPIWLMSQVSQALHSGTSTMGTAQKIGVISQIFYHVTGDVTCVIQHGSRGAMYRTRQSPST